MFPERLHYLTRLTSFIEVLTEQAKQEKINESEFYLILMAKLKASNRELREKVK